MKEEVRLMKLNTGKILKVVVPVASVAVSLLSGDMSKKDQEETIAKKVAEELAKTKGEEA